MRAQRRQALWLEFSRSSTYRGIYQQAGDLVKEHFERWLKTKEGESNGNR